MRLVSGIILGLLSLFLVYIAINTEGSQNSNTYFSIGYVIGTHLTWIIPAIISFFLLKKK